MTPRDRQAKKQKEQAEDAGQEAAEAVAQRTGEGDPALRAQATDDPEEIREEIRETREDLGETVDALSQKTDVKGQVQEKTAERREQAKQKQEELKERASELRQRVEGATPEDVKRTAAQATTQAVETTRQRPLSALGGAFAAGLVVGLVLGRRR